MKISFEDGSFIHVDEATRDDKAITISMCGVNGNRLTMSSSDLDIEQLEQLVEFMQEILKKFA